MLFRSYYKKYFDGQMVGNLSQSMKKKLLSLFPLAFLWVSNAPLARGQRIPFFSGQNTAGKTSCPCIDATDTLSKLANCGGKYGDTQLGILTNQLGRTICVPITHGTSCKTHDFTNDPRCVGGDDQSYDDLNVSNSPVKGQIAPGYCFKQWCYVDKETCKDSSELFYQSDLISDPSLFYSYSTCNSTAHSWLSFQTTESLQNKVVHVTIPVIRNPIHWKEDDTWYKDDDAPWKGWVIDYLNAIDKISNIAGFNFTHRSGGSEEVVTHSKFTAAVYDVQVGISDMAASLFWITSERLRMTAFTSPVALDKVYLWEERISEGSRNSLFHYVGQMMAPFNTELWVLILGTIVLVSIVAVWFSNDDDAFGIWRKRFKTDAWRNGSLYDKFLIMAKVLLDSFLAHGTIFFTQSTDVNLEGSLPQRIFMTGFAFLVLIIISAYTANLAAFLTISNDSSRITSMSEAGRICAHPVLKEDLKKLHPNANFYFYDAPGIDSYQSMVDSFAAGKCDVVAASTIDVFNNADRISSFCDKNLVVSNIVVTEIPIAFPIDKDLAAGMSHWMAEGEKTKIAYKEEITQIRFSDFQKKNELDMPCKLRPTIKSNTLVALAPKNMALVFLVMIFALVCATIIHLFNDAKTSIDLVQKHRIDHRRIQNQEQKCDTLKRGNVSSEDIYDHMLVETEQQRYIQEPTMTGGKGKRVILLDRLRKLQADHDDILQMIAAENMHS